MLTFIAGKTKTYENTPAKHLRKTKRDTTQGWLTKLVWVVKRSTVRLHAFVNGIVRITALVLVYN